MEVKIGDKAPDFVSKDQDGEVVRLSDFTGKKLVLYFYPGDDTPGCTAEACSIRDSYDRFLAEGYVVLGVNAQGEESHREFIEKYNLPFALLADTDQSVVTAYGVWRERVNFGKKYMGVVRTTFVIDQRGVIEDIITQVDTKNHAEQLLDKRG